MSLEKMTGLEIMQAMIAGIIPGASMAETIPMKGTLAEHGKYSLRQSQMNDI